MEFGTEDIPPYPFFRPAIRELRANPEAFIQKNTNFGGFGEIDDADTLVTAIASALEKQMKNNATAQSNTGRSPGTDPDHPRSGFRGMFDGEEIDNTGALRSSITAVRVS